LDASAWFDVAEAGVEVLWLELVAMDGDDVASDVGILCDGPVLCDPVVRWELGCRDAEELELFVRVAVLWEDDGGAVLRGWVAVLELLCVVRGGGGSEVNGGSTKAEAAAKSNIVGVGVADAIAMAHDANEEVPVGSGRGNC